MDEAREQGNRTLEAVSCFFSATNTSAKILEIGCASGSFLKILRDKGFSDVKGVDIDQQLASHGRDILGVNIAVSDWYTYITNTNECFDIIIALDVLEHLSPTEVELILKTTCQKLTTRGKLIMRVPNPSCPFVLPTFYGDLNHTLLVSAELLEHMLRTSGFTGAIQFKETQPHNIFKKIAYLIVHYLFVKPLISILHYHFYGEKPALITRNIYCCATRS
ncbi:MAG: class I SAM-dependent methyltransferase [Desulfuromonadaceae bacterium]|nr:class I SAM-dependent methyltransferase [Desulfuromonadaceae bacterium]